MLEKLQLSALFSSPVIIFSALHHWPQPGGLAYCHDQSEGPGHHPGADRLCHPPRRDVQGAKPTLQLLFSCAALHLQPERRSFHGPGAAAVHADVPPPVPGAQNHPAAQQSAPQRLLQEHRLAQQHQLYLSLRSQGTDEQIPGAHVAHLHPLLLAHCVLDAHTVWEVRPRAPFMSLRAVLATWKRYEVFGLKTL